MANDRGVKPVVHTKKHLARLERERRQTRLILFGFIGILVISLGLLFYGWLDINYLQLQKPVAKVGDAEITTGEWQTRVKIQRNALLATYQQYYQYGQLLGMDVSSQLQQIQSELDNTEVMGQNVLNAMIDEELIRQESAKRGIKVTPEQVEEAVQAAESYYPNGSPTPSMTPTEVTLPTTSADVLKYVTPTSIYTATPEMTATATLEATATAETSLTGTAAPATTGTVEEAPTATATLTPSPEPSATPTETLAPTETPSGSPTPEPTATPYTLEGFQKAYQDKLDAFSKFGLTEKQYRKIFETNLLREQLYKEVTADVPHTQEQVWARHILVADETTAQAVILRLKGGEDFGKVASEVSIDTSSGAQGGDLGWFGPGAMVAPFEEAAFKLKVGEISDPVKSDYGYHVIQVIARQERPLNASEYQQATDKAFQDFLDGLHDGYGVETYDDVWKNRIPTSPSFESLATEAAQTAAVPQ